MDRKWMSANRMSEEYEHGVNEFVQFATNHSDSGRILCPCLHCCYSKCLGAIELKEHLICYGIDQSYKIWTKHGEESTTSSKRSNTFTYTSADLNTTVNDDEDRIEEMTTMFEDEFQDCPEMFDSLRNFTKKPLYDGCLQFSVLSAVLKLYNLKARHGWSDSSFTELLSLLKEMLPIGNELPRQTYEAKRMLRSIGMGYEKIHACLNDCILFRKEHASLDKCPKCDVSRYKKNGTTPSKVLWYFPIIPRFRRMFGSPETAIQLRWHSEKRIQDGRLRHPADSPQWKKIDHDYPDFGNESRNLRLALAADGINPHGDHNSRHSTWPVMLVNYNLPPWLSMKRKYVMLSMLISGPKQPGNDIDIYLAPLIEDLKVLWSMGVTTFDAHKKEHFMLRAMLFGTINDFPAYGNLSGYSVKGTFGCPICEDATCSIRLKHCMKTVFLGHHRFLPLRHHYRRWTKAFNGKSEHAVSPSPSTGDEEYDKVKDIVNYFGKPFSKNLSTAGWKKRSIFYDLPYWKSLYVRHFLDVMHIEKNVCDNLVGTLLNAQGKTKDGIKARLDMVDMGIREELAPVQDGKRTFLPPAAYSLSRQEKNQFFNFLNDVSVPEGYSSNMKNIVSMKDLKLKGLKSHDCHVIMQTILPVAIRSILPENVRHTITKLCFFFKALCSKVIDQSKLPTMEKQIVVILCELEMFFPPSFFDIMVHLIVHLVREVRLCGPVHLRWMYPIEWYMKVLKGYVKN